MMPTFIPKSATEVIVHETLLDERFNLIDPGWENVTHLSINPALSDINPDSTYWTALYRDQFITLKNLWYLQITCKCLRWIEEDCFRELDKLNVLDLSNNIFLKPSDIAKGLSGENNLPSLTELYLSNTSNLDVHTFLIAGDFYKGVMNKQLKTLDISNNDYL